MSPLAQEELIMCFDYLIDAHQEFTCLRNLSAYLGYDFMYVIVTIGSTRILKLGLQIWKS